jgi:hypothetical protein
MTSERITALRRTALFGSLGEEELRALAALELLSVSALRGFFSGKRGRDGKLLRMKS